MNIALLLEMAASGLDDRVAIVSGGEELSYADLQRRSLNLVASARKGRRRC